MLTYNKELQSYKIIMYSFTGFYEWKNKQTNDIGHKTYVSIYMSSGLMNMCTCRKLLLCFKVL